MQHGPEQTPARALAERFGNPDAMRALYAPDIEWTISSSLGVPRLVGCEAVYAFNRQVWTEHHRPDCTVTILDETGDQLSSAVRFIYRAWSHFASGWYENEYSLFVRNGAGGIVRVAEAFDTAATIDFLAGKALGASWAMIDGTAGDRIGVLGR